MNTKFYLLIFFLTAIAVESNAQSANTTLSNLTSPTKVNVNLLPDKDQKRNLGNLSKAWNNLYLDSAIYIDGTKFISTPVKNSIAIGDNALKKIGRGNANVAIGADALSLNTSGFGNIAVGKGALKNNTIGFRMIAIGDSALFNQSTNNDGIYDNIAIGYRALYSNTGGWLNTATGSYSLYVNTSGSENTAYGYYSLASNTTGSANTAIGMNTLSGNTNGYRNNAMGTFALYDNETGSDNIAVGDDALSNNQTGSSNIGVGSDALGFNVDGYSNIAIGKNALLYGGQNNLVAIGDSALFWNGFNVPPGAGVVAVGSKALYNNLSGSSNSAFGSHSLYLNTTGINNTAVGYHAGNTLTTGSSNTIIGYGADVNNGAFSNATAIGNLAVVGASNHIHIGNSSVTSIGGQVSWTSFSDERIKNNIKENIPGLAFINLLKPVTYNFDLNKQAQLTGRKDSVEWKEKYDIEKIQFSGFLAQDVEAAAKKINYDFSGVDVPKNDKDVYGLRYADFVVPLVKAVQELSKMNDIKDAKIDSLQKQMNDLKNLVLSIQKTQQQCSPCNAATTGSVQQYNSEITDAAALEQNVPNPFTNTTTIAYTLPDKFSSAKIAITDKNGNQLKQLNVTGAGKGTLHVDAVTLASGAYQYSLYVDGRLIGSKQMTITK